MKRSTYVVVAITLALFGCGEMQTKGGGIGTAPTNKMIVVQVQNGQISVPEDPAHTTQNNGAIIWTLPPKGPYTFPRDGIVIDASNFSPCQPIAKDATKFICVKRGHVLGEYKYIVNVNDGTKPLEPLPLPPLDPWIYNR